MASCAVLAWEPSDGSWESTGAHTGEWASTLPKLPDLSEVRAVLTDLDRQPPIDELYKCIFCLRQQVDVASQAAEALIQSLTAFPPLACGGDLRSSSVLFRHECCYLLGQIGADSKDVGGVKTPVFLALLRVLEDEREDEVTRHEAAEGIAAVFNHNLDEENFDYEAFDRQLLAHSSRYCATDDAQIEDRDVDEFRKNVRAHTSGGGGGPGHEPAAANSGIAGQEELRTRHFLRRNRRLMAILDSYATQQANSPLGETCYVALQGLLRQRARVCACQYRSFDPAIGDPTAVPEDIPRFLKVLAGEEAELYQRYIAMFTLRNLNAVAELAQVLATDTRSAALRHEIAFILGQLEFTSENDGLSDAPAGAEGQGQKRENVAVAALIQNLGKLDEHPMVRHESAIALGSIGGAQAKAALREFSADPQPMVAESCLVALDTCAYWDSWEEAERRINGE
jgi:HEAT repeat protein